MINESQKWPTDKKQYDHNYLKIFGKSCPHCNSQKLENGKRNCLVCGGQGYIEKDRTI